MPPVAGQHPNILLAEEYLSCKIEQVASMDGGLVAQLDEHDGASYMSKLHHHQLTSASAAAVT